MNTYSIVNILRYKLYCIKLCHIFISSNLCKLSFFPPIAFQTQTWKQNWKFRFQATSSSFQAWHSKARWQLRQSETRRCWNWNSRGRWQWQAAFLCLAVSPEPNHSRCTVRPHSHKQNKTQAPQAHSWHQGEVVESHTCSQSLRFFPHGSTNLSILSFCIASVYIYIISRATDYWTCRAKPSHLIFSQASVISLANIFWNSKPPSSPSFNAVSAAFARFGGAFQVVAWRSIILCVGIISNPTLKKCKA